MYKSKRKLVISIMVLSFVVLSIAATIAIAFALTQHNVKTSLNISYTAIDIDGSVSATYTFADSTNYLKPVATADHIAEDGNTLLFKADDASNAGNLEFPEDNISFTSQNSSIIMQYIFTNNGDVHYIASMDFDAELKYENMKVEYSIDGSTFSEQRYAVVVPANTVETGKSYWIKISVDNLTSDASLTGEFNWLLEKCDEQSEEYLTIPTIEFKGDETTGTYSVAFNGESEYLPANGHIVFPSEVNGSTVTTIANSELDGIEKQLVKSVYIPSSVTEIGDEAFNYYTELEEVIFEQNQVEVPASEITGLKIIGSSAFSKCFKLKEINLPNTVTTIKNGAFSSCKSFTEIKLPNGLSTLEDYAISSCENLNCVRIPQGVTADFSNSNYIFNNCYKLIKIINFSSVSISYDDARIFTEEPTEDVLFSDENGFVFFEYEDNKYKLYDYIGVETDIIVPSSFNGVEITQIRKYAFYNNSEITSVEIPNCITILGSSVFDNCIALQNVVIGDGVTSLDARTFYRCSALTSVTIGAGVTYIGAGTFYSCAALTSVAFKITEGWTKQWYSMTTSYTAALDSTYVSDSAKMATELKNGTITYYRTVL